MEESKYMQNEVLAHELPEGIEVCVDYDHITIPVNRFEELIRAETERNVLLRAYHVLEDYRMEDVLTVVFGSKSNDGENNAQ